jgi:DGQHR domain-containing protein
VNQEEVLALLGKVIDLGPCLLGENLNVLGIRGYASADRLAAISAPDIYDMATNQTGTQRDLNRSHSRESRDYANESAAVDAANDPRAFAEIILNVRDRAIVEVYDLDDSQNLIDFDSFSDPGGFHNPYVGVRVRLDRIDFPKPRKSPQVSRVDGNHRLSGFDEALEEALGGDNGEGDLEFPTIPFALLVGLNDLQEAKLFRDINGTPMKMETDHLLRIEIRRTGSSLRDDPKKRALWIADELSKPGRAFAGKVFYGGSRAGVRKELGRVPELRFNTLRRAIDTQLSNSKKVSVFLRDRPEAQLELIDAYWHAVSKTFPDAWDDKRNYILLQTIGLGGFAIYGGAVIDEAYDEEADSKDDFLELLKPIATIPLTRDDYKGIAGAGGAKEVSIRLIESADPEAAKAERIARKWGTEPSPSSRLAAAEEGEIEGSD